MASSGGTITLVTPGLTIAVGIIFPVLSTIMIVLRFYARRLQNMALLADDIILIPALVSRSVL